MKDFSIQEVLDNHKGIAVTALGFRAEIVRVNYKLPGADFLAIITNQLGEEEAVAYRSDGRAYRREQDERLQLFTPTVGIVKDIWLLVDSKHNVTIATEKPDPMPAEIVASEHHLINLQEGQHK